jgi:hypothetical protein
MSFAKQATDTIKVEAMLAREGDLAGARYL